MTEPIPYGRHFLDEDDIQAVVDVLRHGWLTQGPKVEDFEKAVARYVGARYAVAVSSGTAALHLACLAAGVSAATGWSLRPTLSSRAQTACCMRARFPSSRTSIAHAQYGSGCAARAVQPRRRAEGDHPGPLRGTALRHGRDRRNRRGAPAPSSSKTRLHALGASYRRASRRQLRALRHDRLFVSSGEDHRHGEGGLVTTNSERTLPPPAAAAQPRHQQGRRSRTSYPDRRISGRVRNPLVLRDAGARLQLPDHRYAMPRSASRSLSKIDRFLERRRELAPRYDAHSRKGERRLPSRRSARAGRQRRTTSTSCASIFGTGAHARVRSCSGFRSRLHMPRCITFRSIHPYSTPRVHHGTAARRGANTTTKAFPCRSTSASPTRSRHYVATATECLA